jgi:ribonuclease BN (tRNA processing enzyme)
MSTTSRTQPSYDVFVSDGPVGAGDRMPDGAPLRWSPLSSTLIFGAKEALLVDPPFTRTQIQAVGDWIERSGRRLAYIYATHGHGDHWFGTGELANRFPGVTCYATDGTIEVMRQRGGPSREQLFHRLFPGQIPETPARTRRCRASWTLAICQPCSGITPPRSYRTWSAGMTSSPGSITSAPDTGSQTDRDLTRAARKKERQLSTCSREKQPTHSPTPQPRWPTGATWPSPWK